MENLSTFDKGQENALNRALSIQGYFQHGEYDIPELR
jgi:hypothetical protein